MDTINPAYEILEGLALRDTPINEPFICYVRVSDSIQYA